MYSSPLKYLYLVLFDSTSTKGQGSYAICIHFASEDFLSGFSFRGRFANFIFIMILALSSLLIHFSKDGVTRRWGMERCSQEPGLRNHMDLVRVGSALCVCMAPGACH